MSNKYESEYENYHNFCLNCVEDDGIFYKFRNIREYVDIVENDTLYQGQQYLDVIKLHEKIHSKILTFQRNDLIGRPSVYDYEIGTFCATTLQYVKVACDLDKFLGNLNNFKICEIGGGYGGQLLILDALYKNLDYSMVDLRGSLSVTKKYLSNYELSSNVKYIRPEEVQKDEYDLVISNYAFSELLLEIQDEYADSILSTSKNGYITYNNWPNNYTLNDYKSKFKACIVEDYPTCNGADGEADTKIIFWGESSTNNNWYKYWKRNI